eukprot:CFRG3991T1
MTVKYIVMPCVRFLELFPVGKTRVQNVFVGSLRRHAGHNRWSKIGRDKSITDAQRGSMFYKLTKQLGAAHKESGGNLDDDRYKNSLQRCKDAQVPKALIERTLSKADTDKNERCIIEARGPGGSVLYVECLTDSKARTNIEIKKIITKNGAQLPEPGSLGFMFVRKGILNTKNVVDDVLEAAIDVGAEDVLEDVKTNGSVILCQPENLYKVKNGLEASGISVSECRLIYHPTNVVELVEEDRVVFDELAALIDSHEDVVEVFSPRIFVQFSIAHPTMLADPSEMHNNSVCTVNDPSMTESLANRALKIKVKEQESKVRRHDVKARVVLFIYHPNTQTWKEHGKGDIYILRRREISPRVWMQGKDYLVVHHYIKMCKILRDVDEHANFLRWTSASDFDGEKFHLRMFSAQFATNEDKIKFEREFEYSLTYCSELENQVSFS